MLASLSHSLGRIPTEGKRSIIDVFSKNRRVNSCYHGHRNVYLLHMHLLVLTLYMCINNSQRMKLKIWTKIFQWT